MKLSRRAFLGGGAAAVLGVQGAAVHRIAGNYQNFENPDRPPLALTPARLGEWNAERDLEIDPAALEMLAPDDYLSRVYRESSTAAPVDLFLTYYKSQLRDKNAHSPKVCLPGSGWAPLSSRIVAIPVAGGGEMKVNYYVVGKGELKNLVLYWYQTHRQAVAGEHMLKVHRLWNSIRENRTDMMFVRTISPIDDGNEAAALGRLTRFIAALRPALEGQFAA
jgi:EpsI family protein